MTILTPKLESFRRIVIKIGSSLLVDRRGLKAEWLDSLAADLAGLAAGRRDLLVVSSGAIALGRRVLDLPSGALRGAAAALLEQHPHLRGCFRTRRTGETVQVILESRDVEVPWREVDLTGRPEAERAQAADRVADEDRGERFDPSRPPLMRFTAIRLGSRRHRLL